jgi:hypothetical protein
MQRCQVAGSTPNLRRLLALAASLFATGLALPGAGAQPPAFVTIDRGDRDSRVGIDFSVTAFDNATGYRFDLHAHHVTPEGFGGYALLPISYGSFDSSLIDNEMAVGNVEVGGLYLVPAASFDLVLRGGLTLPSAPRQFSKFSANAVSVRPRLTDIVTITPQSVWLRLAGSLLGQRGSLFYRADLGVDVPLTRSFEIEAFPINLEVDLDPLVRLNLGGGVIAGPVAIIGELVTIANTGDYPGGGPVAGGDQNFEHNFALSIRLWDASVQPSASFVLALDDDANDAIDFMFVVGVQALLR